jgi:hypothetical protein
MARHLDRERVHGLTRITTHQVPQPETVQMPDRPASSPDRNDNRAWTRVDEVTYVQNWENARHLRTVRVLSANAFAVVIAACLAALQFVRADWLMELTLIGFLVAVALIQLLISLALKRALEDIMACIECQLSSLPVRDVVGLRQASGPAVSLFHLRWLYSAFYAASLAALAIAFVRRALE